MTTFAPQPAPAPARAERELVPADSPLAPFISVNPGACTGSHASREHGFQYKLCSTISKWTKGWCSSWRDFRTFRARWLSRSSGSLREACLTG